MLQRKFAKIKTQAIFAPNRIPGRLLQRFSQTLPQTVLM